MHALLGLSEGGGGLLETLGINWKIILVQAVIFLVIFWILRRFLFGPVADFTRKRRDEMDEAAASIEKNRAEIERLSEEYRKKLSEIEKQANERLQEAIREGRRAKAELVARAEEEARKQIEDAREAIEAEKEEAKAALRDEVKRLAVEAARRITGSEYDPERHARIVDDIIAEEMK